MAVGDERPRGNRSPSERSQDRARNQGDVPFFNGSVYYYYSSRVSSDHAALSQPISGRGRFRAGVDGKTTDDSGHGTTGRSETETDDQPTEQPQEALAVVHSQGPRHRDPPLSPAPNQYPGQPAPTGWSPHDPSSAGYGIQSSGATGMRPGMPTGFVPRHLQQQQPLVVAGPTARSVMSAPGAPSGGYGSTMGAIFYQPWHGQQRNVAVAPSVPSACSNAGVAQRMRPVSLLGSPPVGLPRVPHPSGFAAYGASNQFVNGIPANGFGNYGLTNVRSVMNHMRPYTGQVPGNMLVPTGSTSMAQAGTVAVPRNPNTPMPQGAIGNSIVGGHGSYPPFTPNPLARAPSNSRANVGGSIGRGWPYVTARGTIGLRLGGHVMVEMTCDKAIRLINFKHNILLTIDASGMCSALVHPNGRMHQHNARVEVAVFDENGNNKYAKMWYKGVSFTSERSSLVYLVDEGGTRTTADRFSPQLQAPAFATSSVFLNGSSHGTEAAFRACFGILQQTYEYYKTKNGTDVWVVNGIRVAQTEDLIVSVGRDAGDGHGDDVRGVPKHKLKTSVGSGTAFLTTPMVHATASLGQNPHLFVRRGERRLHKDATSLVVRNGGHSAGFDERGLLRVF